MAGTVWKGYVAFGMISIPVRLAVAARNEHIEFHQIHKKCGSRIQQMIYCPKCDRTVQRSELAKGYEVAKGRFILLDQEEIDKVAPASTRTMEVVQFVKLEEVDPLYFDMSYYALPEESGRKAYHLLVQAMEEEGVSALAKVGMHQREYVVVIRARDQGLIIHTMYYPDEVRKMERSAEGSKTRVSAPELKLARQLVTSLVAPFNPKNFRDEFQARIEKLIQAKRKGKSLEAPEEPRPLAPVADLMSALQESLAARKKRPAKAAA
jgi:DNA end-binding protein Ku